MKKIAIYVEGGGDTAQQRANIRMGFDELFKVQKQAAQEKRLGWNLVPSGSRNKTYDKFIWALDQSGDETLCVLLVDSEDPIVAETKGNPDENAQIRTRHLMERDKWELNAVDAHPIHLMVQCMETWIVADPETLTAFYGQGFQTKSLPVRKNLEEEPKQAIYAKLAQATRGTGKGEYAKINHARQLLAKIDASKVAARCSHFATFTGWLDEQIKNA